jgi:hypothetical protein
MDKDKLEELEKTLIAAINGNDEDDVYITIGFRGLVQLCAALVEVRGALNQTEQESWFFS